MNSVQTASVKCPCRELNTFQAFNSKMKIMIFPVTILGGIVTGNQALALENNDLESAKPQTFAIEEEASYATTLDEDRMLPRPEIFVSDQHLHPSFSGSKALEISDYQSQDTADAVTSNDLGQSNQQDIAIQVIHLNGTLDNSVLQEETPEHSTFLHQWDVTPVTIAYTPSTSRGRELKTKLTDLGLNRNQLRKIAKKLRQNIRELERRADEEKLSEANLNRILLKRINTILSLALTGGNDEEEIIGRIVEAYEQLNLMGDVVVLKTFLQTITSPPNQLKLTTFLIFLLKGIGRGILTDRKIDKIEEFIDENLLEDALDEVDHSIGYNFIDGVPFALRQRNQALALAGSGGSDSDDGDSSSHGHGY